VTDTNSVDYDSSERQVVGAAQAAASWARARRAAWTGSPVEIPPSPSLPPESAVPPSRELPVVVAFGLPAPQLPPDAPAIEWAPAGADESEAIVVTEVAPASRTRGPSAVSRALSRVRSLHLPLGRWAAFTAAGALVLTAAMTAKTYVWKGAARAKAAVMALDSAMAASPSRVDSHPVERPRKTTGRLELTSEPAGAQVLLDGKPRGVTPVTLDDLTPGTHAYELRSSEGSVRRSFVIRAGESAQASESIFGGWVKVFAPFEVTVTEAGRVVHLEDGNQIMLPAGRHELHVVNRTLDYDTVHRVEVTPGETVTISIGPPTSAISVNASAPAEVWIDGIRAGETPLEGRRVTVGTHNIVVRRADGDERHAVVTVTVKPFTLDMDFSKEP
jgi:hypothetical protein